MNSAPAPAMGRGTPVEPPPSQSLRELAPCFLYLLVEVGRPADWVPAIGIVRPGLIAAIWGAASLLRSERRPIPRPAWYMIALILLMAINVPLARNNYLAFWGFVNFTVLVVGYVIPLATLPRTQRAARVLVTAYVLLHIPTALHSIVFSGTGSGGWMGDENDVALALNVALGMGYYVLPIQRSVWMRLLVLLAMGLDVAGVVTSNSRGGFVGLAALGSYLILAGPRRGRIISAILASAALMAVLAPPEYWREIKSIQTANEVGDTGEKRIYFWGMAWRMFLDHPITGVGTGNFGIRAADYEDKWRAETTGHHVWGRAAHSLYYTLLAEQGIVGVALFGAMLVWAGRAFWRLRGAAVRSRRKRALETYAMAASIMAGIVALLATGAFLSVIYYPVIWILVGLLAAVTSTAEDTGACSD